MLKRLGPLTDDSDDATARAAAKHALRVRDGHRTPDWDTLSDLMRQYLIYQETHSDHDNRGRPAMNVELCWERRKDGHEWIDDKIETIEVDDLNAVKTLVKTQLPSMHSDATVVAVLVREPDPQPGTGTLLGTYEPAGDVWYWTLGNAPKPPV